jgi:Zinc knuckle
MSSSNVDLRSIIESNKLDGSNYLNWIQKVRNVLKAKKIAYVLDSPVPNPPPQNAPAADREAYERFKDHSDIATCIMLATMNPDLQKQHEHMDAYNILLHLNDIFCKMSRSERYEISKERVRCNVAKGITEKKQTKKVSSDATCFHCGKSGHWRRNCKDYLSTLKLTHGDASTSGIYVIELFTAASTSSWVLDTGCGSHVCTDMQGLKSSRKLEKGEVYLRVANGASVAALAVGTYSLVLSTGYVLDLHNCYCVPVLCRNVVSVSCLRKQGFHLATKDNCCQILSFESPNGVLNPQK